MTTDRSHRAFGLFYLIAQMGAAFGFSAFHKTICEKWGDRQTTRAINDRDSAPIGRILPERICPRSFPLYIGPVIPDSADS